MENHQANTFQALFENLPPPAQQQAKKAYNTFKQNPKHPSLNFEKLQGFKDYYSVRVSLHYRAVAVSPDSGVYVWIWIGTKEDFKKRFGGS